MVYANEKALLEKNGHTVITYERDNDEISILNMQITKGCNALWSQESFYSLGKIIHTAQPDVAHFHNTFLMISPSAYYACQRTNLPVVQTLHNFRLVCPGALLLREGRICEDCLGLLFPWPGVAHACWRNSHTQSAVVAAMLGLHNSLGTWQRKVDRYIALSEFSRQKYIAGGLPAKKIIVKPNFIEKDPGVKHKTRDYVLFIGRLSHEKGLSVLLEAWKNLPDVPLKIAGDGPLMAEIRSFIEEENLHNVEILGHQSNDHILDLMQIARFVVIPSICYEACPLVVIESFACGTSVLVSRIGALEELVQKGKTGLFFQPGEAKDLSAKANWLWEHPEETARMGQNARRAYEEKYTPESNYTQLMAIYQQAISESLKSKR